MKKKMEPAEVWVYCPYCGTKSWFVLSLSDTMEPVCQKCGRELKPLQLLKEVIGKRGSKNLNYNRIGGKK